MSSITSGEAGSSPNETTESVVLTPVNKQFFRRLALCTTEKHLGLGLGLGRLVKNTNSDWTAVLKALKNLSSDMDDAVHAASEHTTDQTDRVKMFALTPNDTDAGYMFDAKMAGEYPLQEGAARFVLSKLSDALDEADTMFANIKPYIANVNREAYLPTFWQNDKGPCCEIRTRLSAVHEFADELVSHLQNAIADFQYSSAVAEGRSGYLISLRRWLTGARYDPEILETRWRKCLQETQSQIAWSPVRGIARSHGHLQTRRPRAPKPTKYPSSVMDLNVLEISSRTSWKDF